MGAGVSPPRLESPKEQRDVWTIATSCSCSYFRLEQTRNIDLGFVNQSGKPNNRYYEYRNNDQNAQSVVNAHPLPPIPWF